MKDYSFLDFIRDYADRVGLPPTCAEIADCFHFASPATVTSHLNLLEKKGVIRREGGRARNIVIVDRPLGPLIRIPVYGAISAGFPEGQEQETDRCITVDPDSIELPRNARTFALEVRGDSMVGAGILDRDMVIMELADPRHRDIVAALIDGDVTLKRFLIQRGKPFLRAENPKYPDLIPAQELVIQGVFRALIRINRARS